MAFSNNNKLGTKNIIAQFHFIDFLIYLMHLCVLLLKFIIIILIMHLTSHWYNNKK